MRGLAFHRAFPFAAAPRRVVLRRFSTLCGLAAIAVLNNNSAAADPAGGTADHTPCKLEAFAQDDVATVIDGRTFRLRDGRVVRMAALELPPDAIDPDTGKNPFSESGRMLARLLADRRVILKRLPQATDRYGRLQAHVFISATPILTAGVDATVAAGDTAPVWLDEKLLANGAALRGSEAIDPGCHARLIAAEASARASGRGLWDTPTSFVRVAADGQAFATRFGRFAIAEGEIVSANTVGSVTYLNFGRIWRRSLTALIAKRDARRFQDSGLDPSRLVHRMVRVRGWVEKRLGPTIVLKQPEQMEIIRR